MDDPLPKHDDDGSATPTHRYLGCDHEVSTVDASSQIAQKLLRETAHVRLAMPDEPMSEADNKPRVSPVTAVNNKLNIVKDNMSAALAGACDKYLAVAPKGTVLRKAKTPFIDEALLPDGQ